MSGKKTILLAVVLALMLPLAGCSALTSDGEDGPDPDSPDVDEEQLQADTLATMQNVSTASVEADITMESQGTTVIDMQLEGVSNFEEQRARFDTTIGQGSRSVEAEQYIIDQTAYMNAEAFGGWVRQDVSDQPGFGNNTLQQQEEILEAADVEVTDETTTDGHEVYVAEMNIDDEMMTEILNEQLSQQQTGGVAGEVTMEDVSVTQHIDVDSNHVRYMELEYTVSAGGQEVSVVFEQRFSDFDQAVDITLPEEAEDATPIGQNSGF